MVGGWWVEYMRRVITHHQQQHACIETASQPDALT